PRRMPLARPLRLRRMKPSTRSVPIDSSLSIVIRKSGAVSSTSAKNRLIPSAPSVGAFDRRVRVFHPDVRCATGEVAVDVAVVDCRDRPLHDLHVLLRNTPSPSPQNGYFMGRV